MQSTDGGRKLKQNITLSLDKEIIHAGKMIAAQQRTTLNQLLRKELKKIIRNLNYYNLSKQKAIAAMKKGFDSGMDDCPSRDDIHER